MRAGTKAVSQGFISAARERDDAIFYLPMKKLKTNRKTILNQSPGVYFHFS
jgi:hypothetical protein